MPRGATPLCSMYGSTAHVDALRTNVDMATRFMNSVLKKTTVSYKTIRNVCGCTCRAAAVVVALVLAN